MAGNIQGHPLLVLSEDLCHLLSCKTNTAGIILLMLLHMRLTKVSKTVGENTLIYICLTKKTTVTTLAKNLKKLLFLRKSINRGDIYSHVSTELLKS